MCGQVAGFGWHCQCSVKGQDLEGMVRFVVNVLAGGWIGVAISVPC